MDIIQSYDPVKEVMPEASIDKLGKFVMECIKDVSCVHTKLFKNICTWTFESEQFLHDRTDWEILFSLLYTHSFKLKKSDLVIYRDGKYVCHYEDKVKLLDSEKAKATIVLKVVRQGCKRAVRYVQSVILDIFLSIEEQKDDKFDLFLLEKHELYIEIMKYKTFIKNHDNLSCMKGLREAIDNVQNSKVLLLVSF